MVKTIFITLMSVGLSIATLAQDRIIIEAELDGKSPTSAPVLKGRWNDTPDRLAGGIKIPGTLSGNLVKWVITGHRQLFVRQDGLMDSISYLIEAGDSVRVRRTGGQFTFSGKGSEKFEALSALLNLQRQNRYVLIKDNRQQKLLYALAYTDSMMNRVDSLWSLWKDRIAGQAKPIIEATFYHNMETRKFEYLFTYFSVYRNTFTLTQQDWIYLYDRYIKNAAIRRYLNSPFATSTLKYEDNIVPMVYLDFLRSKSFDFSYQDSTAKVDQAKELFNYTVNNTSGEAREIMLQYVLSYRMVEKLGILPEVVQAIDTYLALPGYRNYKEWMMHFVAKAKGYGQGSKLANFELTDPNNRPVHTSSYKGKIAIMEFWFTGCKGCVPMAEALRKLEERYKGNKNVIFVSISVDKNYQQWKNSITHAKYTSGVGMQLYTGGRGINHDIIDHHQISSFPKIFLVDPQGFIVSNPAPNPRTSEGFKKFTETIDAQLVKMVDGPYVFHKGDGRIAKTIRIVDGIPQLVTDTVQTTAAMSELSFSTDDPQIRIPFVLIPTIQPEPAVFKAPSRLLALSDLEGNFDALRRLLQGSGVINERFEWIFGDGHLVFVGDMFDRGPQVTECLWLMYSLEQKAKSAGGYVHYILGNHEIMNLNGDNMYAQNKYKGTLLDSLGVDPAGLFGPDTELGRWLRSKNIMEKIGDLLFVHGGIAEPVANLGLNIEQINSLCRPYYGDQNNAIVSTDMRLKTLFHSALSPFWYRRYYKDSAMAAINNEIGQKEKFLLPKASESLISKTRQHFGVERIVTGHTILGQGERISTHFDNRVLNIDTHHAEGKSEALLIDNNRYYRVDTKGNKILLF